MAATVLDAEPFTVDKRDSSAGRGVKHISQKECEGSLLYVHREQHHTTVPILEARRALNLQLKHNLSSF
eukprot:CAMPEP_0114261810 /NCGR_PEP_ID=MMETSP0058-20121206/21373_1 /TAXON_ID=36894 /ORGANISM="Pyramimonas parkeae, CCMP726" /LENGTH=68 /DNA_ID=CAMNT_0001377445 /DNA_START=242 /DNA_END=448 /DNA_ORIENTATION=-